MKVNKIKAVSVIFLILLLCFGIICMNLEINCNADDYVYVSQIITIYSILNLIIIEICLLIYEKRINFFELFIILCYLFSFGQTYAIAIFKELGTISLFNITTNNFNVDLIYNTAIYIVVCSIAMAIGYIILYDKKINELIMNNDENDENHKNKNYIITTAWIVLIITIFPTLYLCCQDIILQKLLGYTSTLAVPEGIDKIFNILKGFFNSAILILMFAEEGKKKRTAYIILIIYLIFEMLGGTRIQTFKFIVFILFLYFEKNKISMKKICYVLIGICVIAIVFSNISASRTDKEKKNFIYEVLYECGHTQTLILVVFSKCPSIVEYENGGSIIRALSSAIPNLGFWDEHPAMRTVDSVFSPLHTDKIGLGSSIFAVAYWNFGRYGGIIFMMLLGMFISRIMKKIYTTNDYNSKFIGYFLLFFISFLVRGDIGQFGRNFVFYCLFIVLMVNVYSNLKRNKKNKM